MKITIKDSIESPTLVISVDRTEIVLLIEELAQQARQREDSFKTHGNPSPCHFAIDVDAGELSTPLGAICFERIPESGRTIGRTIRAEEMSE
jgi:hypothetical protein